MKQGKKAVHALLFGSGLILLLFLVLQPIQVIQFRPYISILFPTGAIGVEERNLLLIIQALMLLVIIPVYLLTFIFSWRYRADNPKSTYDPELTESHLLECIWWGFPLLMTIAIGVLTWKKTHELDPYRPIASTEKTLTIQVIALQWKWLFIYPEEKIATVNFVQFPVDTPIRFEVTADAPMNSFWIPHLGGQIYAMPAMRTELNLIANQRGDFRGSSANLSGEGFSGMTFIARACSKEEYQSWVEGAREDLLSEEEYDTLAKPSQGSVHSYRLEDQKIFNKVLDKYMHPQGR